MHMARVGGDINCIEGVVVGECDTSSMSNVHERATCLVGSIGAAVVAGPLPRDTLDASIGSIEHLLTT